MIMMKKKTISSWWWWREQMMLMMIFMINWLIMVNSRGSKTKNDLKTDDGQKEQMNQNIPQQKKFKSFPACGDDDDDMIIEKKKKKKEPITNSSRDFFFAFFSLTLVLSLWWTSSDFLQVSGLTSQKIITTRSSVTIRSGWSSFRFNHRNADEDDDDALYIYIPEQELWSRHAVIIARYALNALRQRREFNHTHMYVTVIVIV